MTWKGIDDRVTRIPLQLGLLHDAYMDLLNPTKSNSNQLLVILLFYSLHHGCLKLSPLHV
jgi:hypothetical protein